MVSPMPIHALVTQLRFVMLGCEVCRADVAQERKLALETTVLMEKYTVRRAGACKPVSLPCMDDPPYACVSACCRRPPPLLCRCASVSTAQLPDGRVIKFGGERFEAPEALFNP